MKSSQYLGSKLMFLHIWILYMLSLSVWGVMDYLAGNSALLWLPFGFLVSICGIALGFIAYDESKKGEEQ